MLSCAALERSNNSYIESIVKPCVSKNQKNLRHVGLIGKEILKKVDAVESGKQKAELVYLCVREKKTALKLL